MELKKGEFSDEFLIDCRMPVEIVEVSKVSQNNLYRNAKSVARNLSLNSSCHKCLTIFRRKISNNFIVDYFQKLH